MHLKSISETDAFTSPHGEAVRELMGAAAGGSQQHSLAHITLPPGAASLTHYHPVVEESYYILGGRGRIRIDGEDRPVDPGDSIAIPAEAVHQIVNDGPEDLTFLAVCVPPWTPDCSVFLD